MKLVYSFALLLFCIATQAVSAPAADADLARKTRSLDEQTQALKREILELGRNIAYLAWVGSVKPDAGEVDTKTTYYNLKALNDGTLRMGQALSRLEDGVLSPPGIQLVVFLSLDNEDVVNIREITLKLDDKLIVRRSYPAAEITALLKGGTHRLYTGNIPEGVHRLAATIVSEGKKKKLYSGPFLTEFNKGQTRKTLELHVTSRFGNARINSKEWD